uniref:IF rod domain-containing protein n=1 Tax=Esox lucius TaxID=8010 RepID=A0AAY5KMM6_ESOLU
MPMTHSIGSNRLSGAGSYSGGSGFTGVGYGMGLGAGLGLDGGMGMGGGAGLGFGGGGGYRSGIGMGAGGTAAFSMGRTMAAGGLGASAALAAEGSSAFLGLMPAPVLTRAAEKRTLSGLNKRFSGYMAEVRQLQQENAALEANLAQLTGGVGMTTESTGATTTTADYENQAVEYRDKLDSLTIDTVKLEIELDSIRGTAHEMKARYDFEQGVNYQLEADIATMKRDIDMAHNLKIELDANHSSLKDELDFFTQTQHEELFRIQSQLGTSSTDTSVSMIELDTCKSFDIATALNKIRTEYDQSVQEHKLKADTYYKSKMEEVQTATASTSEALTNSKAEISASKKELQGLNLELQSLANTNLTLERGMAVAHAHSDGEVGEYQTQIRTLEAAIEEAKVDLHKQILSFQELLDVKLALDVEITTYRTLLDGEDLRLECRLRISSAF